VPRIEITQRMRIVFFAMLLLASGQVLWWLYDQGRTSRAAMEQTLALYDADAVAATSMARAGIATESIFSTFPHLAMRQEFIVVDPVASAALEDRHRSRMNQYRWEGGFFLIVLLGGMYVLRRTIEAEADLRQQQRDFVAAVGHELKSPLASLQLAVESMGRRTFDEAARTRWLGRMSTDIERLGAMISNILDVTWLEEQEVTAAPQDIVLSERVSRVQRELSARAESSDVSFTLDVPDDLIVLADPTAVDIVLRNLMQNALQATTAASGSVTVRARRSGDSVVCAVIDDGIGFPPDEAERLFERFYRVGDEMVRRTPGSGLGLNIVRRYLSLDGGSIEASSDGLGAGAVFTAVWRAGGTT